MTSRPLTSAPLSGTVDVRRRIASQALQVFSGWGYREIDVPLLDYFDPLRVLDPKQVNRMFRFVDRDGNLLVLRADVTPAIAKIYAFQLADAPLPLRVSYANKVVRIERAFTREQIESYQLGVELIGVAGVGPEIEVVLVTLETLRQIGVTDFEIHLGNAALGDRLIALTGAPKSLRESLLSAIGERDPYAVRSLLQSLGTRDHLVNALVALTRLSYDRGALSHLASTLPQDDPLHEVIASLDELLTILEQLGVADRIHIDLGVVNDQGYYTGTSFKVVSERVGRVLGGGGRYDGLIGRFGPPTPAVGFSLSLEALLEVLEPDPATARPGSNGTEMVAVEADWVAGFTRVLERRAQSLPATVTYG